MWPNYKSAPVLLGNPFAGVNIGWPAFVSSDANYLVTSSPSFKSSAFVIYKVVPSLTLKATNPMSVKAQGTTPFDLKATVTAFHAITNAYVDVKLPSNVKLPPVVKLGPSLIIPVTKSHLTVAVGNMAADTSKTVPVPGTLNPTVVLDGHTLAGMNQWSAPQKQWHGPAQGRPIFYGGDLVYSDYPEYLVPSTVVTGGGQGGADVEGVLYAEHGLTFAASPAQPDFRVYFNHENRTSVAKQICIVFSATGLGESVSQGASGIAQSQGDPVAAGRNALLAYLSSRGSAASRSFAIATTVHSSHGSTTNKPVRVDCPVNAVLAAKKPETDKKHPTPNPVVNGIIDFTTSGLGAVKVGLVVLNSPTKQRNDVKAFEADPLGYRFVDALHPKGNPKRTYATDKALLNPDEEKGHVSGTFPYDELRMTLFQKISGAGGYGYDVDAGKPYGWLITGNPAKAEGKEGGAPEDASEYLEAVDTHKKDIGNFGVMYHVYIPTRGTDANGNAVPGEMAQVLLNPRGIGTNGGVVNAFSGVVETGGREILAPAAGQPGESKSGNGSLVNKDFGIGIGWVFAGQQFEFNMMPPAGSTMGIGVVLAPAYVKAQGTLLYDGVWAKDQHGKPVYVGSQVASAPVTTIFGLTPR